MIDERERLWMDTPGTGLAEVLSAAVLPLPPPRRLSRLWWTACHGGAGVSTLAYATGVGVDGGRDLPAPGSDTGVVLVCRATAMGLSAAARTVGSWTREAGPTPIMALVVVAASPRPVPDAVAKLVGQVAPWVPSLWRVPWDEGFIAADHPGQVRPSATVKDIAAVLRLRLPPAPEP